MYEIYSMNLKSTFSIYNASAGSGKTYTLVKEYLKILISSKNKDQFKNILAITFTNKAVGEMKERIIQTLKEFSEETILIEPNSMFKAICEELPLEPKMLHKKAITILHSIIHNYAAFDVSTIDGFTHKLIRTFAFDLKLPLNFEVELDQDALLNEAVDSLIAKAGSNKELTKVLIDFAIEKADDDKSWDISYDFNKIAKLLISENDIPFLQTLKDKTLENFSKLKTQLKKDISETEGKIVKEAQDTLSLIEECGLQFDDFSGQYLPKHFLKLAKKNFAVGFEAKWQDDIENKILFPKRVPPEIASIIQEIQPQIALAFNETKTNVFHLKFLKAFYRNITPLSVLNLINQELFSIKQDQNKMLISEFNTIISNEIKDQPTPFIYERLGEKFRHYFIDEFQDTSHLQWSNLIPLISNSLSSENGSAMLVGDSKQAIYRWRGGKAEQFIDLYSEKENPFQVKPHVENLPTNYRSFKEVVAFNNGFFKFLASSLFNNKDYETLYDNSSQEPFIQHNGFVNISFLDITKDVNRDDIYPEEVLAIINQCLKNEFALKDICVLVRKKKEGIAISNYLSQHGIPITSSETLLLQNSPEVGFINNFLKTLIHPDNSEVKVELLNFLANSFQIEDKHHFFETRIHLNISQLLISLEQHNIYSNYSNLLQLPLYDLVETIVRDFNIITASNAYVQFYLDVVLDFSLKQQADISSFVTYFEKKKDTLSIVSPVGQDAIQIMTIHKSKGLEFPVVIFPYADLNIYNEREPKEWFKLNSEKYNGFSHTLLNYNQDFENFNEQGRLIYNKHQSELELDNLNLLYVVLTRPIEHLYVISKKEINKNGIVKNKTYSGFFINYLKHLNLWDENTFSYDFGSQEKKMSCSASSKTNLIQSEFISSSKEDHNIQIVANSGYLWDTIQHDAIEKGNLIHNIMSHIVTMHDVEFVINDFEHSSLVSKKQAEVLKEAVSQIVNHSLLKDYFKSGLTIYNERDIISISGEVLRPDRLVINSKGEAVIIDYKTGLTDEKHQNQLYGYQRVLEEINLKVVKKILVYINERIIIKEF